MNREERRRTVISLRRRGFDNTFSNPRDGGTVYPRCSQCEALVINGIATHESSCPNQKRRRKR